MIVPDVVITDVQEDLSGMTVEMDFSKDRSTDGTRSFSFRCNGTPYSLELDSHGDWFNGEALDFMEDVLRKEGGMAYITPVQGGTLSTGNTVRLFK